MQRFAPRFYVLSGALLCAFATLARPLGIVLVLPLLVAASTSFLWAALQASGCDSRIMRWATFGSFAVRWVLAIVLYCASLYHWSLGRSLQVGNGFWLFSMDSLNYHSWAPQIVDAVRWGLPLPDPGATIDYYLVIAMIYTLFGTSPLTAIAVNIFAWTLAVVGLITVFTRLRHHSLPSFLIVVLSLWPSGLIWPTQLMKDSLVLLFLVLAVGAGVLLIESCKVGRALTSAAVLWLALLPLVRLRIYVGRILFAGALAAAGAGLLLWVARRGRWRSMALAAVVAAIAYYGVVTITVPDPFVVLAPADPAGGYVRFAQALRAKGALDEARSAYKKALEIDPTMSVAADGLRELTTERARPTPPTPLRELTTERARPTPPTPLRELTTERARPTPLGEGAPPPVLVVPRVLERLAESVLVAMSSTPIEAGDALSAMTPDELGQMRKKFAATGGGSALDITARLQNWDDAIKLVPVSIANGLLAPFPWDVLRPRGITGQFRTLAVSESMLMFLLLPAIVLGFARLRRPEEIFVAALAVGGLLAVSLVITNLGTLFRLRVAFTLTLVAFAAYGFDIYAWAACRLTRSHRANTAKR